MHFPDIAVNDWVVNFIDDSPVFFPFDHLKDTLRCFSDWPCWADLNALTANNPQKMFTQSGMPIRFVPQIAGKPQNQEQQYESRIYSTGNIPTRECNWHDFFNALVWQIFPATKALLNQIHYQALQQEWLRNARERCALRDAATLFDESGVIVVSDRPSLLQLLKDFAWRELFWQQRESVRNSMRFFVFGHGLYEKALKPYTGMTGKGLFFEVDAAFFAASVPQQLSRIDAMLVSVLSQTILRSSDLAPVPLLGYPGWVKENDHEVYYENKQYFRDRHYFSATS